MSNGSRAIISHEKWVPPVHECTGTISTQSLTLKLMCKKSLKNSKLTTKNKTLSRSKSILGKKIWKVFHRPRARRERKRKTKKSHYLCCCSILQWPTSLDAVIRTSNKSQCLVVSDGDCAIKSVDVINIYQFTFKLCFCFEIHFYFVVSSLFVHR